MKTLNLFSFPIYFLVIAMIALMAESCSEKDDPQIDCTLSGLTVTTSDLGIVTCSEGGKATLNATGGTSPYKYSVDGVKFGTTAVFTNLTAKAYTGTVTDANGCQSTTTFSIDADNNVVELVDVEIITDAGCGTSLGKITITATGGTGAISYGIDGKPLTTSNEFTNLGSGNHTVVIRDSNECQISETVYVPSGVKFGSKSVGQSESISDIISTNCAITGCHVAGGSRTDFTVFANIKAKAAQIKAKTQDGSMPKNNDKFTPDQIDLIACWVEDGALDN